MQRNFSSPVEPWLATLATLATLADHWRTTGGPLADLADCGPGGHWRTTGGPLADLADRGCQAPCVSTGGRWRPDMLGGGAPATGAPATIAPAMGRFIPITPHNRNRTQWASGGEGTETHRRIAGWSSARRTINNTHTHTQCAPSHAACRRHRPQPHTYTHMHGTAPPCRTYHSRAGNGYTLVQEDPTPQ